MALGRRRVREDSIGSLGDMEYLDASGIWVPVSGTHTIGNVPTVQGGGTIAWAAQSGGLPAWVTYHPDTPPTSPTTFGGTVYDIEFVRDATLSGHTVLGAPATTPSIVDRSLRVVSGAIATADIKGVEWTCPGSAFTMTAKIRRKPGTTFGAIGPMLRRNASGAGNIMTLYSANATIYTATNIELDKYTTLTARTSAVPSTNWGSALWLPYYAQMIYDGTNITTKVSLTGQPDSFLQHSSETAATFLGGAPGRFGIIMDNFGTTANTGYCEWIRFT